MSQLEPFALNFPASTHLNALSTGIQLTTRFPHAETSEWFSLGDLARVNTSKCPFCCLVAEALHEDYKATRPKDGVATSRLNPVNVFWFRDARPDGKGAFIIYGLRSCLIGFAFDDLDTPQATESFCLRTVARSELDYPRIANWISTCAETHAVSCGPGGSTPMSFAAAYPGLHVLRLIDPGSLKEAWPRLPRTIQDTIRLIRDLSLRHVWVNALCLVQNNTDDLERGVKVMDNIYEQSRLTIVAATGHNAKTGLPGSSWTIKSSSVAGNIPCPNAPHKTSETPPFEMSKHAASQNLTQLSWLDDPVKNYAGILEHYTSRALTNQGDALQALAGTMRRVGRKLGQEILQVLPSGEIDSFLLFRSASGGGFSSRRRGFPSWSWAGWEQAVTFGYDDIVSNWPECQNWIVCSGRWRSIIVLELRMRSLESARYMGNDGSSCGIIRVDGLESGPVSSGDDPWEFILLSEHSDEGQDQGLDAVYTIMLLE
ncbi:hypothetical protein CSOJ01_08657 [Colletotrichum sojae]|uniref:Heterokaryon incompatibility domain-containing protein n=1 Tax=Colletotrichum sojae TaxID=2175907 RepID=A0A8H6MSI6_9PEZI|nr:hypothetical protein CSOJ01_08657 [Colletotrichum sojae]